MQPTSLIPESKFPRVVIIGGGFGGLMLAKELRNKNFQVILIDKNNFHTFQPLLYQVASGGLEPDSIAYPIRKIFKNSKNIFFRLAEVSDIDTVSKVVNTNIGTIDYDYLVIATGSTSNFFGMKDIEKYSMPLKSITDALDLRSLILQNLEKALNEPENREAYFTFVIVGGGPTGVEVAGALAELRNHVLPMDYPELKKGDIKIYLIESDKAVLASMSDQSQNKALQFLQKLGVHVKLNVRLLSYDGDKAELSDGSQLISKTLVWSAGVRGASVNGLPENTVTKGTRINVNRFNQVESFTNVFAIGDVANMIEEKYPKGHPMLAQVAMQQGTLLGKNLMRLEKKEALKEFSYFDKGSMATVGRNKAVVDLPFIKFQGAFAWFTWMIVHIMSLVGFRNRLVVFINWLWNYFSYDRAIRLIIRPFSGRKNDNEQMRK